MTGDGVPSMNGAAVPSDRQTLKVAERVHEVAVDAHFEMHMGTGAVAGAAFVADRLTLLDLGPLRDGESGHVAVERGQRGAMGNDDVVAVTVAVPASGDHLAGGGGRNGRTVRPGDVNTGMEVGVALALIRYGRFEGVRSWAEALFHGAVNGPDETP